MFRLLRYFPPMSFIIILAVSVLLSTWTEVCLPSPSMGEGEGGGEVGSQPGTLGHPFPPIPTFPR